ncbi:SagB/ThcOx family dehydrogenase [Natronorubrum sulfidifaciens]|uniref:SagB-type dehydrogenase domain-containing protein n=1 Tax=Natronorubrum sulfidifaciens JCM 14089 TaxID=1230460 RepID=L9W5Q1_9EURY|nr:SagB/ThcOx family dehydrogenase [Natronorubrum sulfidifaciens]ELY44596.1 SagB-type dehydrogenase domain-containing protein [Natronorubrum sulfidifaciens JCM 14089]
MASIDLPDPETDGSTSVERAIATRTSRRSFARPPLELADVAQLLWAAQGVTHVRDGVEMRTAPSAGATYPLVAFLEVAPEGCAALDAGLYRYEPGAHRLEATVQEAIHDALTEAALGQAVVQAAPATIVLAAEAERTRRQYPDHGDRYVHMEAGHAAQNVHLVCESRTLQSCPVGAFDDDAVAATLELPARLEPLYLVPVGNRPADQ